MGETWDGHESGPLVVLCRRESSNSHQFEVDDLTSALEILRPHEGSTTSAVALHSLHATAKTFMQARLLYGELPVGAIKLGTMEAAWLGPTVT